MTKTNIDKKKDEIKEMLLCNMSVAKIAEKVKLSVSYVRNIKQSLEKDSDYQMKKAERSEELTSLLESNANMATKIINKRLTIALNDTEKLAEIIRNIEPDSDLKTAITKLKELQINDITKLINISSTSIEKLRMLNNENTNALDNEDFDSFVAFIKSK